MTQHRDVVTSVAKSHGLLQANAIVSDDLVDTDRFAAPLGHHIGEQRVPTGRLAMGQSRHDLLLLLSIPEKGDQLKYLLAVVLLQRAQRRKREIQQAIELASRVVDIVLEQAILLHQRTGEPLHLLLKTDQRVDVGPRNGMLIDGLTIGPAIATVERHVAIELQRTQIVNRILVPTGGNKHLHASLPQRSQSLYG